jgi:hypothetical protein
MTKEEKSLINAIKKNSTVKKGRISISKFDNVKYRYDTYIFNYPNALNYLVEKYEKLAGRKNNLLIENFSIHYERPIYKGQRNGTFIMTELIENIK